MVPFCYVLHILYNIVTRVVKSENIKHCTNLKYLHNLRVNSSALDAYYIYYFLLVGRRQYDGTTMAWVNGNR